MATLVVITHQYDAFLVRDRPAEPVRSPYLLFDVLRHLQSLGHICRIVQGPRPLRGDAALLHVDATIVGDEYLRLASHYPRAINFATGDISKRKISRMLVDRDKGWDGPVLVKSNYNDNAISEDLHNRRAAREGEPLPHPSATRCERYRLFGSSAEVPDEIWADDSLVVERFIPENDPEGGFVLRTWVFMGPRERCTRYVTADPISKASDVLRYESVEVPPQLREERERLRFDFGKFDFVMHNGEPVLLDANRTPGVAAAIQPLIAKGASNLAHGLDALITARIDDDSGG